MKKTLIISARGEESFTPAQVALLRHELDVRFLATLEPLSDERLVQEASGAQVLAITRRATQDFHEEVISQLPSLQGVVVYATGLDWIDLPALSKRNIALSYLPDYSTQTVAEHTLAMILTLSRRIHLSAERSRGLISPSVSIRGFELFRKRVGVIGMGRIGRAFCRLLAPFENEIYYCDLHSLPGGLVPGGREAPMSEILSACDIVVLAASRKRNDPPLMDKATLPQMKKGAYLVNPSRAALVDNHALLDVMASGALSGYAVDDTVELFNRAAVEPGRILQTAHSAWYSNEAMERGNQAWVEHILALAKGERKDLP